MTEQQEIDMCMSLPRLFPEADNSVFPGVTIFVYIWPPGE